MPDFTPARIYPTMITPYTQEGHLDLDCVDAIIEYYVRCGSDGVFAVCQSSEMFYLSDEEKITLLKRVVQANAGRLQVVASGHTADDMPTQIRQLTASYEAGAQAVVIVLNRLARQEESEDVVKRNMETLFEALPDAPFGIYECPYPYKRLASPSLLRWVADSGRVQFFKDTCCDVAQLQAKQDAVADTNFRICNANTSTLLPSLRMGMWGYSGVMANMHADLYAALIRLYDAGDARVDDLQDFLTFASLIERQLYPVNAKYKMQLNGVPMNLASRSRDAALWTPTFALEVETLLRLENAWRVELGLPVY